SVLDVIATSAATRTGLDELRGKILEHVPAEAVAEPEAAATHRVYRPGAGDAFRVARTAPGAFRIEGERVERLVSRHDPDNEEAMRYVEERLRAMGVLRALESAG